MSTNWADLTENDILENVTKVVATEEGMFFIVKDDCRYFRFLPYKLSYVSPSYLAPICYFSVSAFFPLFLYTAPAVTETKVVTPTAEASEKSTEADAGGMY